MPFIWSMDYIYTKPNKQHELAKLLSAANKLKESYVAMIKATDEMVKSKFIEVQHSPDKHTRLSGLII